MRPNIIETVLSACRADPVIGGGGSVVVAVSGGPDSTSLLHALTRAAPSLGLSLTAAHLDHGLRRASRADARKVAALCERLGVPLVSGRAPAGAGRSEDAARRVRYSFLDQAAAKTGAETIALGHTADDQAETVLLHLVRGAGLEGLAAMAPREGKRFRPLLGVWRADVLAYCRRHRLEPVDDASNRSPRFLRNRVRRDLIPALETYNPKVKASLVRLASIARQEHDVVEALASEWVAGSRGRYSRRSLQGQPEAVRVAALRRVWGAADSSGGGMGDAARLSQALRLIDDRRSEGMMDLGGGLHLYVDPTRFYIASKRRR